MCRNLSLMGAVLLCAVIAATCPAAQYEAGEVVCPKTGARIVLDGKIVESAWRNAAPVGPLVSLGTRVKPIEYLTRAKLMRDDDNLYVAVLCDSLKTNVPEKSPRDNRVVYGNDHIELFLGPFPDSGDYYQLVFDRAGNIRDSWITERNAPNKGAAWNGKWRVAVAQNERGWTAEVVLPFKVFGVKSVRPGDVWRLKIGRGGRASGNMMWPPNPTTSFHSHVADAALYFDKRNLLINGDFEAGKIGKRRRLPRPWGASLTSREVKNAPQGTVEIVAPGVKPGKRAARVTKLATAKWWPQLWNYGSGGYRLQPGGVYEFSVMAKGTMPQVNLRATAKLKRGRAKMSRGVTITTEWRRYCFRFVAPETCQLVGLGMSAPRQTFDSEVTYDNAILRRVLHSEDAAKASPGAYGPPDFSPDPDPIHGLEALCERAGHKPWDLFRRGDQLLTYRVMFKDRAHGTWLWLVDKSPSTQVVVTASVWPGWNADGSVLRVGGGRMGAKGIVKRWLCNSDFSRLWPMPAGGQPLWDLENPDVYYFHSSRGELGKVNLRTGEQRILATWKRRDRERSYGLTKDNRSVFVTDHDGGYWVPYKPTKKPLPSVRVLDCYGETPDKTGRLRSLNITCRGKGGPLLRILVGTRIYTDTGRMERVIVPICGHTDYLKTFISGRVKFPADAKLPETKDLDKLFQLYHLYPSCSHGHISYSPDGEYVSWDGQARSYRVRDHGDRQGSRLSPNGGVYHTCWYYDPRFYVTCVRAYGALYDRVQNSGVLGQVFTDGTWQPVCAIKQRPAAFYYQGNFATLSRDATKVHYESSMTGVPKNYVAVMARPQPPRSVCWKPDRDAVVLSWKAPPHHKEIKGYLVYRSPRSGDGYTLLTPKPVAGATWRDATVKPGRPYYYVVTSVEHCGVESGYSAEAAAAGVRLPGAVNNALVVYAEAEDALVDLYTSDKPGVSRGRDQRGASNWYYVYRSPKAALGKATLRIPAPATANYFVWLRARQGEKKPAYWTVSADGRAIGKVKCARKIWTWVRVGRSAARLSAGERVVTLSTVDPGAQADLLCLSTDPRFTPRGPRPEDRDAPSAVQGLSVVQVRGRAVRLKWRAGAEPDFWHYNVYAGRIPITRPDQGLLLASPTYCEFVDWGLRPGTAYYYAVTAVDRRGNESPLGSIVKAAIAPRPYPAQEFELCFDRARLKGKFKRAKAKGTRGKEYVIIPERTRAKDVKAASASWPIRIKHAGKYYFWLRFLPKSAASVRSAAVRQSVEALIGGKRVTSLAHGLTDLSVPESGIRPELWTWARPVRTDLEGVKLQPGAHTLTLKNLTKAIRYDTLFITDEPSFTPKDGRLKQR